MERACLAEGVALFRRADPSAAAILRAVVDAGGAANALDRLGARFDRDLALFYLSEIDRQRGFEAMFRGRLADALGLLERAVAGNPENFQALYGVAVCANGLGDYETALGALHRLRDVERCPTRLSTHIAAVLLNAGRSRAAAALLEPMLAQHPRFADVNHLMGVCRWKQGQSAEAIACFRTAIETNPRFALARARLACALVRTGQFAEATRALGAPAGAPRHDARLAELRETLAAIASARGPRTSASASLRDRAEKLAAEELYAPLAIHPLAVGLHVADDEVGVGPSYYEALAGVYRELVQEVPHHAHLHYRLGLLALRLGRTDEVAEHYRRAVALDGRSIGWPGVAAGIGDADPGARRAGPSAPPGPIGRYDEARNGVNWDFDPAAIPSACYPPQLARRVGWGRRMVDLALSTAALVALAPLLALVALAIRVESRGPVIFRQTRVGWNGRRFTILKFRTMVEGASENETVLDALNDADGPMFKIKHDPRVTRVGRFLRRRSLDELPQLVNVLRGDMTLLGPRPLIEREVGQMTDWELRRLLVTPGLACLAQVCGRSDLRFHEWIRLDNYYVSKQGLRMDLGIAWRAIESVLAGKGAY